MKLKAVIFDIYNTLMEVGPPPRAAGRRWVRLCAEFLPGVAAPGWEEFLVRGREAIARSHARARAGGVLHPEVQWPAIAQEAWPALRRLGARREAEFLVRAAALERTVRMPAAAASCLRQAAAAGLRIGLASNAQAYTLSELAAALRRHGLGFDLFDPALRFLSFERGFAKPDPDVFRHVETGLRRRGIEPGGAMMVGDRFDNDIEPARGRGWRTWHLCARGNGTDSGTWRQLRALLAAEGEADRSPGRTDRRNAQDRSGSTKPRRNRSSSST